jgi:hypothetical protein
VILAVTLLVAWLINRDITDAPRPEDRHGPVSERRLATVIPGTERREIGGMAATVLVFGQHDRDRTPSTSRRLKVRAASSELFCIRWHGSTKVGHLVGALSASTELEATAQSMTARRTRAISRRLQSLRQRSGQHRHADRGLGR